MVTCLAHIVVRHGLEREFEELIRHLHTATHSTESAVRRYEYWRGAEPRTYYALLAFDDYAGFVTHQASDHHERAAGELGRVIESIRLEWVDPVPGAGELGPTVGGPIPDDAGPVARRYAERMPVQVAPWWGELDRR